LRSSPIRDSSTSPAFAHSVFAYATRTPAPEIEPASDRAGAAQDLARAGQMRAQTVQFFRMSARRREKGRFLVQPLRIERLADVQQRRHLLREARLDGIGLPGGAPLGRVHERGRYRRASRPDR
jgi:hypothetical protein